MKTGVPAKREKMPGDAANETWGHSDQEGAQVRVRMGNVGPLPSLTGRAPTPRT